MGSSSFPFCVSSHHVPSPADEANALKQKGVWEEDLIHLMFHSDINMQECLWKPTLQVAYTYS